MTQTLFIDKYDLKTARKLRDGIELPVTKKVTRIFDLIIYPVDQYSVLEVSSTISHTFNQAVANILIVDNCVLRRNSLTFVTNKMKSLKIKNNESI